MRIKYYLNEPNKKDSDASFNRVSLFCKGLNEHGIKCDVYLIPHIASKSLFISRVTVILNYCRILINVLRSSRDDIFIFYGETAYFYIYPIVAKLNFLLIELNEYPIYLRALSSYVPSYSRKSVKYLKYAQGFITCSSFLKSYYKNFLRKDCPIFISPLIVDVNLFKQIVTADNKVNNNPAIVYCGSFNNNKDGVPILIESFSRIHKIYNKYELYLIGGGDMAVEKELQKLVCDLGVKDYVFFTGFVAHDKLYSYFQSASVFALARPDNKQAEGGIPSKLAEYMAMGRPCVITEVGDLPKLFEKDVDCYMAQPSSVDSFTEKLLQCIRSDNAKMVHRAYEKIKSFNYLVQAERLLFFINTKLINIGH